MFGLLLISSISFLAALSGAIVPGPVFALVLSESAKGNKSAGPLIVLGHFMIEAIIILMIFAGFQQLFESEDFRAIVGYVGGVMLALMGLKLILDAMKVKEIRDDPARGSVVKVGKTSAHNLVFSGFLASCSNPHFFLWWLAIGLPVMMSSISTDGVLGFFFFLIGHAAADLSWFSFVGYSIYRGRKILGRKIIRVVLISSAVFLIYLAINIIISSTLT